MTLQTTSPSQQPALIQIADEPTFLDPKTGRRATARELFGPKFRGAVSPLVVEVKSDRLKALVRRDFIYLSRLFATLHRLENGIEGLDTSGLPDSDAKLKPILDGIKELAEKITNEMLALVSRHDPSATGISAVFARVTRYEVPICHPLAYGYMRLFATIDEMDMAMSQAWHFGLITTKQKAKIELDTRKAMRRPARVAREMRLSIYAWAKRRAQGASAEVAAELNEIASAEAGLLVAEAKTDGDPEAVLGNLSHEHAALAHQAAGDALAAAAGGEVVLHPDAAQRTDEVAEPSGEPAAAPAKTRRSKSAGTEPLADGAPQAATTTGT